MGGIDFITTHEVGCLLSVAIAANLLHAAEETSAERFVFSSSACVYPVHLQNDPDVKPLAEDNAFPVMPDGGYGWERLFSGSAR